MTMASRVRGRYGLAGLLLSAACGVQEPGAETADHRSGRDRGGADGRGQVGGDDVRLAREETDQVLGTLVIPLGRDGMALTSGDGSKTTWTVDMQTATPIKSSVAPEKYLRVKGSLEVPTAAGNISADIGCLFIELKDNVYYRETTWLRLATRAGIHGKTYNEVVVPLAVDLGGSWQDVPALDDSLTLQEFAGNTVKRFDGTVCLRLDFADLPAQAYEGELLVQYLRTGDSQDGQPPVNCAQAGAGDAACKPREEPPTKDPEPQPVPAKFVCDKGPVLLKAGQQAELAWSGLSGTGLDLKLAADDPAYKGALGTVTATGKTTALYVAPKVVPANTRIIVTARPLAQEALPAFCEVRLQADDQICVQDDGETEGLTGNLYQLPAHTNRLPDFAALTPIDQVIVPNLDIPERNFSVGFPGVKDLVEWFGLRFRGRILSPVDGVCEFKVTSDDGANLYIDGVKIVDNDGLHYTASKTGSVTLAKGAHDIQVDYYQGPRYHITMQLFWRCGAGVATAPWTIVPPAAFTRPLR